MDSWEETVSDVMYAGGMQCEATMLESKALIVLDAEMENLQITTSVISLIYTGKIVNDFVSF